MSNKLFLRMKKFLFFTMVALFMMALCSCSKDEGNSLAGDKNDDLSGFSSETEVYNDIIGEWKLVRTVGPNIDYIKFFPDYSFIYSSINAGINNYEGRYQIIEKKSEVGTVDYQTLPSDYSIRIYPYAQDNPYLEFAFAIEGDIMHLQAPYTFSYSSGMYERIK